MGNSIDETLDDAEGTGRRDGPKPSNTRGRRNDKADGDREKQNTAHEHQGRKALSSELYVRVLTIE